MKISLLLLVLGCTNQVAEDSAYADTWSFINLSPLDYVCGEESYTHFATGSVSGDLHLSLEEQSYISWVKEYTNSELTPYEATVEFDECDAVENGIVCRYQDPGSLENANLQISIELEWLGQDRARWHEVWDCDGECTELDYVLHPAGWEGEGPAPVYPCTMEMELELSAL